ncbi:MAG TPA: serine/threonine-protein kinase [Gemmatimonadales bacterium]|nr:serine/threonine-protein kinase [Gemmatimonadales bacterium]
MPEPVDQLFLDFQTVLAGRYSLERELGRGGMGVVYLAREVALDRLVAIKLLPPKLAADPALRERFQREARTAARLSQPNIVPIHVVDEAAGFVWFVMAFIEGQTLGERVRTRGPLTAGETTRMLREIAWALAYAHAQGVIHRDLKPDNILIERATGRAVLTDFGIARRLEASGLTAGGELIGTPEFMSPEQVEGNALDGRSDLYSLGIVGFYCLSGRLPFEAGSLPALLVQQATEAPPALGRLAGTAPRELTQAVMRCLEKEPADRFPDAKGFADALSIALETRRETPATVRVFVNNSLELKAGGCLYTFVVFSSMSFVLRLLPAAPAMLGYFFLTLLGVPFAAHIWRTRRLLRAGYDLDDVLLGVRAEMERKREELVATVGHRRPVRERLLRFVGWTLGGLGLLVSLSGSWLGTGLLGFGGAAAMLTGLVTLYVAQSRRDVIGERRLRYFGGRLGRWIFKLAGLGLGPRPGIAAGSHRPTELAIAFAAEDLFEELPKEIRAAIPGVPETLQRLEQHARAIRTRMDGLEQSLMDAGRHAPPGAQVQRDALLADLTAARDAARTRLSDTVAALESIRLDLLRLRAGSGNLGRVTADLQLANEVGASVDRLLAGQEEIERSLRGKEEQDVVERVTPGRDAESPQ